MLNKKQLSQKYASDYEDISEKIRSILTGEGLKQKEPSEPILKPDIPYPYHYKHFVNSVNKSRYWFGSSKKIYFFTCHTCKTKVLLFSNNSPQDYDTGICINCVDHIKKELPDIISKTLNYKTQDRDKIQSIVSRFNSFPVIEINVSNEIISEIFDLFLPKE